MSKHTPGPWCVRDLPTAQRYIGPSYDGGAPSVAFVLARVNVPDERLDADARLIAAAPELLEALQAMLREFGYNRVHPLGLVHDEHAALSAAISAIAKATGEQA